MGNRIRELREKLEMTQDELADSLNCDREKISRYENDKIKRPDYYFICDLADVFNVSSDYFRKGGMVMNKGKLVRKYILELLSDGKEHKTSEIRNYVAIKGVKLEPKSTLVRNVLFCLKQEDPNFVNSGRGMYQIVNDSKENHYRELKNAISIIEKEIKECKNFNWLTCNDVQLEAARAKAQLIIEIRNTIEKELSIV